MMLTPQHTPDEMSQPAPSSDAIDIMTPRRGEDFSRDPVLFAVHTPRSTPLLPFEDRFAQVDRELENRPDLIHQIERHRASQNTPTTQTPPSNYEYALSLLFQESFKCGWLDSRPRLRTPTVRSGSMLTPSLATPTSARQPLQLILNSNSTTKVQKKKAPAKGKGKGKAKAPAKAKALAKAKAPAKKRSSAKKSATPGAEAASGDAPEPKRSKSTKPNLGDHYTEVEEFQPPSVPMVNPGPAVAKVKDFSGGSNDLSRDPERHMLNEYEIMACEKLSLTGAKYLLARGQVIKGYLRWHIRLINGKVGTWNRTAGQNCSNIDVNKVSCLWQFFHDIGWFHLKYYEKNLAVGIPDAMVDYPTR